DKKGRFSSLFAVHGVRTEQSFFQKFREIAPTVRHDMDMNCMDRFMDTVDYAVWSELNFPVGKNIDSLQFGRDAPPIREKAQAVPGLDELFQDGVGHVRAFSFGDEIENA